MAHLALEPWGAAAQPASARVQPGEIERAMRLQQGYDLRATSNGVRFQGGVILQLVRWAQARAPDGPPLLVRHDDYFASYLAVTGLEGEDAPTFARLPYLHRQDLLVEYRAERVIAEIVEGPRPDLALAVRAYWPDSPGSPGSFSYEDTTSNPHLRVTHRRVTTYRLLVYGDIVVYDQITGISGRATSGPLGVLFSIIGEGDAVQSRTLLSPDGLQVTRATARKGFAKVSQTVTVFPDGRGEKGTPRGRPDLDALARRLQLGFEVRYHPIRFEG